MARPEFSPRRGQTSRLVLASASPRRADLLRAAGYRFVVRIPEVEESALRAPSAGAHAERLAREKALDVASRCRPNASARVLAADTIVAIGRSILGKPRDARDARRMLRLLSGRTHRVITGVALGNAGDPQTIRSARAGTRVSFRPLSRGDIERYVASGDPADKAGAYGIQNAASLFVTEIRGSWTNVVGLPMEIVFRLLGPPQGK